MPKIEKLLEIVKSAGASDLHLAAGSVPMIRVNGILEKTRHRRLAEEDIRQLVYEIMTDGEIKLFEKNGDLDVCYSSNWIARVRLNVYRTQTGIAAAIRLLPEYPPDLTSLGFSEAVQQLLDIKSGLILVTGPANSGKTTTLAAMVDYINTDYLRHIVTLEAPIEFIHKNKNSLITQRQIGIHALSFSQALGAALHEDPDVIVVGEMRDMETISMAVTAAEVGLLVIGSLHTCGAEATIRHIIDVFPRDRQLPFRIMLADALKGIISQQLLRRADGSGRILAYELMLENETIANMIRDDQIERISAAIQDESRQGMRLMDNQLKILVDSGQISAGEAARFAAEPSRFLEQESENEAVESVI